MTPVLLVAVAGCAGPGRRSHERPPDWENLSGKAVVQLPPDPVIAPPPTDDPRLIPAPARLPIKPEPPVFSETWVPLARWAGAHGLDLRTNGGSPPEYVIRSTNAILTLRAGSQNLRFSGMDVRSGFVPQLIDGQPYIHHSDVVKTLQPLLLESTGLIRAPAPLIVLDPGHGGMNAGTRSVLGNHYEKEFTLDWAQRLKPLLETNGFRVLLTRTSDVDLPISNRVAFAQHHNASLFLSLHFNSAAPNEVEAGLETYCLTPAGMPSTLTRGYGDDSSQTFPNNLYDTQNLQLATRVHEALLRVNGHNDRGVRRARFPGVLRGQQCPAILVEGGYLSNPGEARAVAEPAYRQKLAEAVAQALAGAWRRNGADWHRLAEDKR